MITSIDTEAVQLADLIIRLRQLETVVERVVATLERFSGRLECVENMVWDLQNHVTKLEQGNSDDSRDSSETQR